MRVSRGLLSVELSVPLVGLFVFDTPVGTVVESDEGVITPDELFVTVGTPPNWESTCPQATLCPDVSVPSCTSNHRPCCRALRKSLSERVVVTDPLATVETFPTLNKAGPPHCP